MCWVSTSQNAFDVEVERLVIKTEKGRFVRALHHFMLKSEFFKGYGLLICIRSVTKQLCHTVTGLPGSQGATGGIVTQRESAS